MDNPIVVFGVDSVFAADVVETALRTGHTIGAAILTGAPEWDLGGLAAQSVEEIADSLRQSPAVVPWVTPGLKAQRVPLARACGFTAFPVLADPHASLPRTARLGIGVYLNAGATIGAYAELDAFALINRNASLGHHGSLSAYASIGPGATVAARCSIGRGTMIGAGAIIGPGVRIGANCLVAMGAVVSKDVADNCMVAGNPARVIDTRYNGYKDVAVD